jgi:hypothetical protein
VRIGWNTGVTTVLENVVLEKAPEVKLTVDRLLNCPLGGIALTLILNVTVADAPGASVPSDIPPAGLEPGCTTPFTVTLPATKEAPGGIGSEN